MTYGSEVVLTDTRTGISTAPLIVRKVDKGKVVMEEGSPVSQMQKIALQRVNNDGTRHYLSAAGPLPGGGGGPPGNSSPSGTHPLLFQAPREREEVRDGMHVVSDEVDDYLCWTIVGICRPFLNLLFRTLLSIPKPSSSTRFSMLSARITLCPKAPSHLSQLCSLPQPSAPVPTLWSSLCQISFTTTPKRTSNFRSMSTLVASVPYAYGRTRRRLPAR